MRFSEQTDNSFPKPLTFRDFYGALTTPPEIGGDKGETQSHKRGGNAANSAAAEGAVPTAGGGDHRRAYPAIPAPGTRGTPRRECKDALWAGGLRHSGDRPVRAGPPAPGRMAIWMLRVAAYYRVSTDDIDQVISIELQRNNYRDMIRANPKWKCGYTRCLESLWRVLRRGGLTAKKKPGKKYKPKPYEQMQYPGRRVQIDVKVVPRSCIEDAQLKLYQYTAIDEYSRYRVLGAYMEQSTYSSAGFLGRVVAAFRRKGVKEEYVQTDNGFEFTNRFSNSKRDRPTLFETTAAELGIRHKRIRPYTPRHNGKVERSHREDQKRFYDSRRFWSLAGFGAQLLGHQRRSNSRPMCPLR